MVFFEKFLECDSEYQQSFEVVFPTARVMFKKRRSSIHWLIIIIINIYIALFFEVTQSAATD